MNIDKDHNAKAAIKGTCIQEWVGQAYYQNRPGTRATNGIGARSVYFIGLG